MHLLKSNRNGNLTQFGKQKVGPAFDEEQENYLQLWRVDRALSAMHLTMLFPLQHGGPRFHKVLELLIFRITVVPKILSFV